MARPLSLLLVEDSEDDAELILLELRRQGFAPEARRVLTEASLISALDERPWDLVISDHNLPSFSSLAALGTVKARAPHLPFIVVSGSIGEEYAVEAMRAGAHDFVVKAKLHRLAPIVERELREAERRAEQQRTAEALRQSEDRLRQSQKLEAVGRLAGGVAHDFNNLLTAILGYTDLVLRAMPSTDARRADLEEIKSAGIRAMELTRQLLAFGRQQVRHERVLDMGEVIEDVSRLLRRVIGEDIALVVNRQAGLWHVLADRTQLEQIIVNLAVNARDAMSNGGTLTLEVANFTQDGAEAPGAPSRPGDYVLLKVRDTGDGIPDDVLPRIFEPFFTTKEPGKGTGLGLATVYGIVEQSGGVIDVTSRVGHGTEMSVYFPRTLQAPAAASAPATTPEHTASETILLVEDEGSVRELTARVLREAGYRVLVAPGAQAALDILASHRGSVDLLLTDFVMPDLSGPALADRVRERLPSIRVLVMSGFSHPGGETLDRFGPDALLSKPFTQGALLARVRDALDREQ